MDIKTGTIRVYSIRSRRHEIPIQVYGKYNTQPLDELKLDLLYVMNFSLMLDLEIMVETVYTLFGKDGTEGFSKELIEYVQK